MRNESFPIDMGKYKIIITQNNMQVNYVKNIKNTPCLRPEACVT